MRLKVQQTGILKCLFDNNFNQPIQHLSADSLRRLIKTVESPKCKIYTFQLVYLYDLLDKSNEQSTFQKVDNVLLRRENLAQRSFNVLCRRLFCLIKYGKPFKQEVQILREMMHDGRRTQTELQYLLGLKKYFTFERSHKLRKLYSETLQIMAQQYPYYEYNHVADLKIVSKTKSKSGEEDPNSITQHFYQTHGEKAKLQLLHETLNPEWLFDYYLTKINHEQRKPMFMLLWLMKWSHVAPLASVQGRLPDPFATKVNYHQLTDRIFGRVWALRPFMDEYIPPRAQFQTSRLKDIFYYLTSNKLQPLSSQKLAQIVEFIYNAEFHTYQYCLLLTVVKLLVIPETQSIEKAQQQLNVLKQMNKMRQSTKNKQSRSPQTAANPRLSLPCLLQYFCCLELPLYRTQAFRQFYGHYLQAMNSHHRPKLPPFDARSLQLMHKAINKYMQSTPMNSQAQCSIFYGQLSKIDLGDPQYEVMAARNVQVDRILTVEYLLHVRNKATGQAKRVLLDTRVAGYCDRSPLCENRWREYFLMNWCKVRYYVIQEELEAGPIYANPKLGQILSHTFQT